MRLELGAESLRPLQGRIELLNPSTQEWGTMCGHHYWVRRISCVYPTKAMSHNQPNGTQDNDNAADIVCKKLGFSGGSMYNYGATTALPSLPIVAGFRKCDGTESSVFECEVSQPPPFDVQGVSNSSTPFNEHRL
jgi:hypothetical protein